MFICAEILFCVFLNFIDMIDLHLDKKKVVFCQNCVTKKLEKKWFCKALVQNLLIHLFKIIFW